MLGREPMVEYRLEKGYRSSFEIYSFAQRILQEKAQLMAYQRHELGPQLRKGETFPELLGMLSVDLRLLLDEGMQTVAVITKSHQEAMAVHGVLRKEFPACRLAGDKTTGTIQGITVVPGYGAKGLEFDAVLVYDVSRDTYHSDLDRRLLYIACTRALHRLYLYYCTNLSPVLSFIEGDNHE